jgi:hypothetical protein
MRVAIVDHETQAVPVPPAEIVVLRGAGPAPGGYRWFSSWLGEDAPTAIGFAPGALHLHGLFSLPLTGRLAAWALRLWRPSDMVTIVCCVTELDQWPDDERDRGARALIDRLDRLGEGTAVIIAGGLTVDAVDQLVDSARLERVAPGEDRILVARGIDVTTHDPSHGVVDLAVRHRRELINERRWTRPGAEVVRLDWWYQPERSARQRCDGYADAIERLDTDSMGGGTISLTYLLQDPDGPRLETTVGAGSEAAGLRLGDRVRSSRYVVHQPQRKTAFDSVAEALRCAWAWAADEVVEELTLGRGAETAVTLPGDRVRIRQDWG